LLSFLLEEPPSFLSLLAVGQTQRSWSRSPPTIHLPLPYRNAFPSQFSNGSRSAFPRTPQINKTLRNLQHFPPSTPLDSMSLVPRARTAGSALSKQTRPTRPISLQEISGTHSFISRNHAIFIHYTPDPNTSPPCPHHNREKDPSFFTHNNYRGTIYDKKYGFFSPSFFASQI